jgi:hypothetical protein
MSVVQPIQITGLKDFQRALKDLDGESQKALRVVFNDVAAGVAQGAARRVPTRTGRARASIKAVSGQRDAKVRGGSRKAPYYGWLDFGGRTGRQRSVVRPFVTGGRYLYPAFSANRDTVHKALEKGLQDLVRRAGLEVD